MIHDFLQLGQIVSTHGIKGEVRFDAWCDGPDYIKQFGTVYFDEHGGQAAELVAARPHGRVVILKLKGVDDVNAAQLLRGKILYVRRADAPEPEGTYVADLIGCKALDADDESVVYGEVTDVQNSGASDIWFIKTPDGREILIPAIDEVVKRVDAANERVYITPMKGLF